MKKFSLIFFSIHPFIGKYGFVKEYKDLVMCGLYDGIFLFFFYIFFNEHKSYTVYTLFTSNREARDHSGMLSVHFCIRSTEESTFFNTQFFRLVDKEQSRLLLFACSPSYLPSPSFSFSILSSLYF